LLWEIWLGRVQKVFLIFQ